MQEGNKCTIELSANSQFLTYYDMKRLVDFSVEKKIKHLTVPQCYLKWVKNYAQKRLLLGTIIDCPNGYSFSLNKLNAIKLAIKNGANEVDIALNHSELKSGNIAFVEQELKQIRRALRGNIFKLYVNLNYLNDSEFSILNHLAYKCSVDYLAVDFNYDENSFVEKYNLLRRNFDKKIKIKLLTNYAIDRLDELKKNDIDVRFCFKDPKV